jgi:ectoine hydroxylase-related dioxygenase (phytanoyl-CoA dioxygenase family)
MMAEQSLYVNVKDRLEYASMRVDEKSVVLLERIVNDGFAVMPNVFSEVEMVALGEQLECSDLPRSRAGIRHAMRLTTVSVLARAPRLLGIAQGVLGTNTIPFRATLFAKLPTSNWLVAWHQDTAMPLQERRETLGWGPWSVKEGVIYAHAPADALSQVIALRVHLDDSTAENGPLRVLPKTHTLGVLTDEEAHQLAEKIKTVECPVPRGGVLAMRPLIVHASSKSQSENPRRVLHIEYAKSPTLSNGLRLAVA